MDLQLRGGVSGIRFDSVMDVVLSLSSVVFATKNGWTDGPTSSRVKASSSHSTAMALMLSSSSQELSRR